MSISKAFKPSYEEAKKLIEKTCPDPKDAVELLKGSIEQDKRLIAHFEKEAAMNELKETETYKELVKKLLERHFDEVDVSDIESEIHSAIRKLERAKGDSYVKIFISNLPLPF